MNIAEKLIELGLELPQASTPGGSYVSVNVRGNIAYVAVQFPILNGTYLYQGRLGSDITTDEGYKAMQLCALNVIAQVHEKIGFDTILGLNHIEAFYQSDDDWDDAPIAVNGASDLFLNALGDKGKHTRTIFGVHKLPRNFCIGLTASFTLNP